MGLEDDSTKGDTSFIFGGVVEPFSPNLCRCALLGQVLQKCSVFQNLWRYIKTTAFAPWFQRPDSFHFSTHQAMCQNIEPGLVVVDDLHANHPAPSTNIIQSQQINPSSKYSPLDKVLGISIIGIYFFDWTSRTRPISIATFSKSHSAA